MESRRRVKKTMQLKNLTKNTIVSGNLTVAESLKSRIVGLINSGELKSLYFKTRWGIHTFGMKFAIDCLILDKNWKVAAFKKNIAPQRIFAWNPKHFRIIELPQGSVKASNTAIGDILKIEQ
jgi:hypothetical protein